MKKTAAEYCQSFHITREDVEIIQQAGKLIAPKLNDIISKYTAWLHSDEGLMSILGGAAGATRNAQLKKEHWASVFGANIDADYIDLRYRLGYHHADIGMSIEQHFSIVTQFVYLFENAFEELNIVSAELHKAFTKFVNLDLSIVLQAYSAAHDRIIHAQTEAILAMSAPIAQLWTGILFLPLLGIVDSKRAHDVMSTMLTKVATLHAKIFILDISGIAVVDTAVANHFIKIARATRLMGCRTLISGISPAVAQTIVELGIDVADLSTTSSMQDAIRLAFSMTGIREIC